MNQPASHTPGPWAAFDDRDQSDGGSWSINSVDQKTGVGMFVAETIGGFGDGEEMANALLIAAAPDLLAACEAAQPLIADFIQGDEGIALASRMAEAIRRARNQL